MARCSLAIALARPDRAYAPGEPVTGTVTVEVDAPCENVRLVLVSEWRTGGRGDAETGGRVDSVLFEGAWQPGGASSYPFAFDAPWGPLTYRGRELTVTWHVEAHADLPWALDQRAALEWTMVAPAAPDHHRAVSLGPRFGDEGWGGELLGLAEEITGWDIGPALAHASRLGPAVPAALGLVLLAVALWELDFGRSLGLVGLALGAGGAWLIARSAPRLVARWGVGPVDARLDADEVHRGGPVACIARLARPWMDRRERVTATLTARERMLETVGSGKRRRTVTHLREVHAATAAFDSTRRIGTDDVELQGRLTVPADAPPTFAGRRNALEWEVTIRIAPRWGPAWTRRIPLTVRP